MTLRVLSLATLFPDAVRPNFGLFVEKSLRALSLQPDIDLTIVAPVGFPPFPLSFHRRYRPFRRLPRVDEWDGLAVHRPHFRLIPSVGAAHNPAAIAGAVLPLVGQWHRDRPFDVIDAQFFYPDGAAAMKIAAALNLPFSIKARGADISHFGHDPATAPLLLAAAQAAAGLLAVSEAMRGEMAAIGIDSAKVRVHYTGIDAQRFYPADRDAARRALQFGPGPLIATIGALIPRKGQALVIEALPLLPDVTYALAGSGDSEGDYRTLAERLGVADRVKFLGAMANADLPQLYRAADAVVMPSVSEGLANAWVEALACGTPIVISDAGGAAELITSPAAGHIAARTPEAIAHAVRDLVTNPRSQSAVAASLAGRFDWDRNGRELADHLHRIARVYSDFK